MLDHDFGHLCRGRRNQKIKTLSLGKFQQCWTVLHFDLGGHPVCLAITSRTFAAVICDADEPCFVNTAYEPESCFATAPRSTTRPFHVHGWKECLATV